MKQFNLDHIAKVALHPLTIVLFIITIVLSYTYIDLPVELYLSNRYFRINPQLLKLITNLADGLVLVPILLGAIYFRYVKNKPVWEERFWFLSVCIIFSGLMSFILKCLFGRARPNLWFSSHEYGFYWFKFKSIYWSFPSGHTTTILSIVFGLIFLFPKHWIALLCSGVLIASTRVLLGNHYVSDVFAASYFTLLEVLFLIHLFNKHDWLPNAWSRDPHN